MKFYTIQQKHVSNRVFLYYSSNFDCEGFKMISTPTLFETRKVAEDYMMPLQDDTEIDHLYPITKEDLEIIEVTINF